MNADRQLQATIPEEQAGMRLDLGLASLFREHSRARLQNWIRCGRVRVDGQVVSQRHRLKGGERIEIDVVHETREDSQPEAIPLDIVAEDEHIIVINKPAGLVVHPGAGNRSHTLLNALLHHDAGLERVPRAGIVHRLDKDTTGLMVIARTPETHTRLVEAMQARHINRQYLALVRGQVIGGGQVEKAIGRHPTRRTRMAVQRSGKHAVTHYSIEERLTRFTLLRCRLETGRTHQIRVHMAHIKHPLVGDPGYGGRARLPAGCDQAVIEAVRDFHRQALHACELQLAHPVTGKAEKWQAPLPADFQALLETLRRHG